MTLSARFDSLGINQTIVAALATKRGPLVIGQWDISRWLDGNVRPKMAAQLEATFHDVEKWVSAVVAAGLPKPSLESVENIERGLKIWGDEKVLTECFAKSAPLRAFAGCDGYEPNLSILLE